MTWVDSPILLSAVVKKVRRPTLGVMARPRVVEGQFVGKQGPVLLKYLETARKLHAFACVFDPAEVDCARGRLVGFVLDPSAHRDQPRVQKVDLPIPRVVYDQVLSRRYERTATVVAVLTALKEHAAVFNGGYFDKWEVHGWLSDTPELKPYVPATELLTGPGVTRRFLEQYPSVFVKPIHGSLGLGIVRVLRKDSKWTAVLRAKTGNQVEYVTDSAKDLYAHFRKRWQATRHVIQQGLPLLLVSDRPVDIRVITQKNQVGEWQVTKLFVRMAGDGEFISNLTTGGEAFSLSELAKSEPSVHIARAKREIRHVARLVPNAIESASGRLLGELGIDVGLCADGRPYIIEVNSKPWKAPETVNGSAQLVELSFERPIRFALHLAQMPDSEKGVDS